ncbi:hypothetical protein WMY93_020235 [Mugilogobius chulae]|uniref:RBR-type E3 ubiquitin transferase n=1 Tax=Mugilogobius chulae TaxID=88201 RepID=A0AAW0NRG4_9GOBI
MNDMQGAEELKMIKPEQRRGRTVLSMLKKSLSPAPHTAHILLPLLLKRRKHGNDSWSLSSDSSPRIRGDFSNFELVQSSALFEADKSWWSFKQLHFSQLSSVERVPNPKCKRQGRISFHSLFHSKRSRGRAAKGATAAPVSQPHSQPLLPSTLTSPQDQPSVPPPSVLQDCAPLSCSRPSLSEPGLLECPLCLVKQPPEQLPELLGCSHRSCLCCLRQYLRIEITESRVQLSCPECAERLVPRQVADILDDPILLEKYEEFLLRRCLASDPDCRWCPAPDCG